jgi:hypothetical protein
MTEEQKEKNKICIFWFVFAVIIFMFCFWFKDKLVQVGGLFTVIASLLLAYDLRFRPLTWEDVNPSMFQRFLYVMYIELYLVALALLIYYF